MAILSVLTDQTGMSGIVPKMIYINTNDNVAKVTSTGYLNALVSDGFSIKDTDIAMVSTKVNPSDVESSSAFYSISRSGADWSLSEIGGGTVNGAQNLTGVGTQGVYAFQSTGTLFFKSLKAGNGIFLSPDANTITIENTKTDFSPATNYFTGSVDGPITGNWQHLGRFEVQAGTDDVILQSNAGSVNIVAPTAGQLVAVQGDGVQVASGLQNLQLTSTGADVVVGATVGNVSLLSPSLVSIDAPDVKLSSILPSVTSEVLYYDSASKSVTFGAAPGGGSDWKLNGTNSGPGLLFGTNSADGWVYQANSVSFASVSALGATTYTGSLYVNGLFEVQSPDDVIINAAGVGKTMSILSNGDAALSSVSANVQIDAGLTMVQNALTSWEVTSPSYKLLTLPAATYPDVVFFNSVDGSLGYGSSSGLLSSAWKIDGSNNTVGLKLGTSSAVGWDYQVNGLTFASVSSSGNTSYTGGIYANGAFEVHSPENVVVQTNNGSAKNVTVEADATLFLNSTNGSISSSSAGNTTFNPTGTFNATSTDFVVNASNNANVLSVNNILVRSSSGNLTSQATLGSVLEVAGTSWEATAPVYKLNSLASATKPDVVYFDSATKELSYGALPSIPSNLWKTDGSNSGVGLVLGTSSANGWSYQANNVSFATVSALGATTYTGSLQANGSFGVNSPTTMNINTSPGSSASVNFIADQNMYIEATNGSGEFYAANGLNLTCDTTITAAAIQNIFLQATQIARLRSSLSNVEVTAQTGSVLTSAAADWQVTALSYKLATLPSASTPSVVYYNTTSKELTHGALPAQTYPVVNVSNDITMAVNTIYHVTLFSPLLTLPATSAKGDTIKIRLLPTATMFSIIQGAGQIIYFGIKETILGSSGYIQTTQPCCTIELECIVANTQWQVVGSVGNFDVL